MTQTGCPETKHGCIHQKTFEIMAILWVQTDRPTDHRFTRFDYSLTAKAAYTVIGYLMGNRRKGKPCVLHITNTLPNPQTFFGNTLEEASVTDNNFVQTDEMFSTLIHPPSFSAILHYIQFKKTSGQLYAVYKSQYDPWKFLILQLWVDCKPLCSH